MISERAGKEENFMLHDLAYAPSTDSLPPERPNERDKVPFDVRRGTAHMLAERGHGTSQDPTKAEHVSGLNLGAVSVGGEISEFQEARRHPTEKARQGAATNVTSKVCRENCFAKTKLAAAPEISRIRLGVDGEKVSELLLDVAIAVLDHHRGLLDREIRIPDVMGVLVIEVRATLPRPKRGASRKGPRATEDVDLDR